MLTGYINNNDHSQLVTIHTQFVASKNEITNQRINEFCFHMFWFWFFGGKTYDCNPSVQVHKVGNIWFLSPLVLSKRTQLCLECRFFWKSVFIFQFLNAKIYLYVLFDMIVNFITQKLKNKHTFLKNVHTEKAEELLIFTEREETKTKYFTPRIEEKDRQTQLLCYVSLIRACNKVL